MEGIEWLKSQGFRIYGVVIDGMKGLPQALRPIRVQMCQFYQMLIVRRYITQDPDIDASAKLLELVNNGHPKCPGDRKIKNNRNFTLSQTLLFFGSNEKQKKESLSKLLFYVRAKGLEPPRRKTLDPKSSAATNYATPALFCLGLQI